MKKTLFIIIWSLLFLRRCDNPTESVFQKELSVKAFISPCWDQQEVYVYYSTENVNENLEPADVFVNNAEVTITGGGQSVKLSYVEVPYKYIDYEKKLKVIPGERYTLIIKTDIGEVTGETEVPDVVNIIEPIDGAILQDKTPLRIKWDKKSTLPPYEIIIYEPPIKTSSYQSIRYKKIFYSYEDYIEIDSTYIRYELSHSFNFDYIEYYRRYTIHVIAVDENYKNYYLNAGTSCGIRGGYGFFGSATVDSVDFYVVE